MTAVVQSISDFAVISLLGKGSMGDVWHAKRKNTNETYAIKTIEKTTEVAHTERVCVEREILASVNSPFVIQMHWAFEDDSCVYFVLEHAVGDDLGSVMRNFHPDGMSEDHARFYIAEILLALEYLHRIGIILRDLKPANCLTTASGHIKLADFGHSTQQSDISPTSVCRSLDRINQEPVSASCSDGADCVGTPEYMAPETLQDQTTTKMVDYWSLGIIMYELIYACLPWGPCESSDCVDLFFSIITKPVPLTHEVSGVSSDEGKMEGGAIVHTQPRRRCKRVCAAATNLIIGLLEKDPANRAGTDEAGIKAHRFFNMPGSALDWAAARRGELVPPTRKLPYCSLQTSSSQTPPETEALARGSPILFLRNRQAKGSLVDDEAEVE